MHAQLCKEVESLAAQVFRNERAVKAKQERDAAVALLLEVVEKALPDSPFYNYAWDECGSDEQDYVKDIRGRIDALLAAH